MNDLPKTNSETITLEAWCQPHGFTPKEGLALLKASKYHIVKMQNVYLVDKAAADNALNAMFAEKAAQIEKTRKMQSERAVQQFKAKSGLYREHD